MPLFKFLRRGDLKRSKIFFESTGRRDLNIEYAKFDQFWNDKLKDSTGEEGVTYYLWIATISTCMQIGFANKSLLQEIKHLQKIKHVARK